MSTKIRSRRGQLEIMGNMLSLCVEERKKTHVMYGANLSYQQLCVYLKFLTSAGLLTARATDNATFYEITVKGSLFLSDFRKIESMLQKPRGAGNREQRKHNSVQIPVKERTR